MFRLTILGCLSVTMICGCYALSRSQAGGQTKITPSRQVNPADIALEVGYRIEPVATGLNMPSGIFFVRHYFAVLRARGCPLSSKPRSNLGTLIPRERTWAAPG